MRKVDVHHNSKRRYGAVETQKNSLKISPFKKFLRHATAFTSRNVKLRKNKNNWNRLSTYSRGQARLDSDAKGSDFFPQRCQRNFELSRSGASAHSVPDGEHGVVHGACLPLDVGFARSHLMERVATSQVNGGRSNKPVLRFILSLHFRNFFTSYWHQHDQKRTTWWKQGSGKI